MHMTCVTISSTLLRGDSKPWRQTKKESSHSVPTSSSIPHGWVDGKKAERGEGGRKEGRRRAGNGLIYAHRGAYPAIKYADSSPHGVHVPRSGGAVL